MIRSITIAASLLAVVGCSGESQSTTPTTIAAATESEPTTAVSTTESTATDPAAQQSATTATTAAPTTEAVAIEGASSSEDAVSDWFDGIQESDLSRMWNVIDPALREDVSRSAWDACIAAQFTDIGPLPDSIDYDEAEVYSEGASTFSTGTFTAEGSGQTLAQPVTFQVVEREGGWFIVGPADGDDENCLTQSSP